MVLTVLYPPDGVGVSVALTLTVDIVFVHGLNGDATGSWTNPDTKAFWPKDFLPSDIPDARVMTFGYNADAAFGNTTADIVDHAKDLLSSLIDKREEEHENQRPIIFIAHSLGGIVVKQALVSARIESQYSPICEHTTGIIFFGTPHHGSDKAAYGKILTNVASTVMRKPNSKLLSALETNSDTLARLTSDFRHQLPQYEIVSFYERKPLGIFKKESVEKQSALLEVAREDQIPVDANHRDMCKFSGRDDGDYEKLFKRIRRILRAKGDVKQSISDPCNKHYLIPHNVSAVFTGRYDVCKMLQESCLSSGPFKMKRVFVLYGLGGSGKTQVSLKFAQDNRESFWGVFWIDSSNDQTIEQGFSKIAQSCQIEDDILSIRTWLSNIPQQWLLIFDNADDPSIDISRYFPVGSRGTILITTRNPECKVHQTVGSYEFAGMGVEEAVDLLLKAIGTDDLSSQASRLAARSIVTTLGSLSLAIIQAGAVIRQKLCRLEDYCDTYRRRRQELLSRAPTQASSDYKYTVYTTWEVSVNMIEGMGNEVASHALELLRLFSFFHFDGISEEIFRQAWGNTTRKPCSDWKASYQVDWFYEDDSEWDPYHIREAIALLSSFSLIQVDGLTNNVSIHPLVHAWARDRLGIPEQEKWSFTTALILADSISWRQKTSDYSFRRSLISHVTTCITFLTPEALFIIGNSEEERLETVSKFIWVLVDTGQWQKAVQLQEQVLEVRKRTFGDEHPDTLRSMGNLAASYSDLGRRQEAVELEEKVLEIRERTLRDEHPDILLSISNLARSYSDLGRRQEAVELEEKVLEIRKRILGDEHPDTLLSISNLARSYSDLGRQQEAVELEEKVLEIRKRILGDEHPDTLRSINNLAASYSNLGRQQEAIELEEKVLEIRKRILGNEHPDTLRSISNLAMSYSYFGRQQEAIEFEEKVLEVRKRIFGDEHPDTLLSISNLAVSYNDIGRQQEAIKLKEKVLEIRRKILGDEHPDTLLSISNLAMSYYDIGRRQEAIELEEKSLEVKKRTLGDEHPDTLLSIDNLEFYLTNLANPLNLDLYSTLQPEYRIERKIRSRWTLRSLAKRIYR
ncbi:Uncharacterized protein BP5553_01931 [Venustampulla echinocandica]|uniref:Uncharacterized protein n=1 Tax=Venustampulla echinocandica TaxID=2656787 RepID=A0A370U2E7_9HELO|nr:Uncharacterized protein BP5553_01931 [Venustampulla echinocandica]RDL41952.1 Uncharacterized protein BP5553_01931 [Venustampulla echinocandica]